MMPARNSAPLSFSHALERVSIGFVGFGEWVISDVAGGAGLLAPGFGEASCIESVEASFFHNCHNPFSLLCVVTRDRQCDAVCSAPDRAISGKRSGRMPLRFSELEHAVVGVTQKVLISQLKDLQADAIVLRTLYPQVPPKVEYSLTPSGLELRPALEALIDWENRR